MFWNLLSNGLRIIEIVIELNNISNLLKNRLELLTRLGEKYK
jgi:hypothetical protein